MGPWPLAVALVPWAVRWVLTGRPGRRTPFDLPIALFLVTAGVGLATAFDRNAALLRFWQIVAAVLLFYALANAGPASSMRSRFLALFGAAVSLYFLLTNWDTWPVKIELFNRLGQALQAHLPSIPGPRWHPNTVGGVVAALAPFALLVCRDAWQGVRAVPPLPRSEEGPAVRVPVRAWLRILLGLAALALTALGVVVSTSRGAWMGLAAAAAVAILWAISGAVARVPARCRARTGGAGQAGRVRLFLALLAAAVGAGLIAVAARPERLLALADSLPGPNTVGGRLDLLRNTPLLAGDYWLIGAGLGSFQMLYSTYALLLHVGYTLSSHNVLLDVAVEMGMGGALALVAAWALFALLAISAELRQEPLEGAPRGEVTAGSESPTLPGGLGRPAAWEQRRALGAAALSLVVIAVHGLVDHMLYSSGAVLLLFAPLAFAAHSSPSLRGPARRVLSLAVPAGLLLLIAAALVWHRPLASRIASNLGAVHQSRAELSLYSWPDWPIQDSVRREIDLARPISEFERALELDPGNPTANRRLAMIELARGQYKDALLHLEAAYRSEPHSQTTRQLLGEAYIVNGRQAEGEALWASFAGERRQLAARIWWYEHIGEPERAQALAEAAGTGP